MRRAMIKGSFLLFGLIAVGTGLYGWLQGYDAGLAIYLL
jgi:hypothetical protein